MSISTEQSANWPQSASNQIRDPLRRLLSHEQLLMSLKIIAEMLEAPDVVLKSMDDLRNDESNSALSRRFIPQIHVVPDGIWVPVLEIRSVPGWRAFKKALLWEMAYGQEQLADWQLAEIPSPVALHDNNALSPSSHIVAPRSGSIPVPTPKELRSFKQRVETPAKEWQDATECQEAPFGKEQHWCPIPHCRRSNTSYVRLGNLDRHIRAEHTPEEYAGWKRRQVSLTSHPRPGSSAGTGEDTALKHVETASILKQEGLPHKRSTSQSMTQHPAHSGQGSLLYEIPNDVNYVQENPTVFRAHEWSTQQSTPHSVAMNGDHSYSAPPLPEFSNYNDYNIESSY